MMTLTLGVFVGGAKLKIDSCSLKAELESRFIWEECLSAWFTALFLLFRTLSKPKASCLSICQMDG